MLKELQIGLNFFWKLFEWIKDRYEKTLVDSTSCERIVLNYLPLLKDKTAFSLQTIIHEFYPPLT